MEFFCFLPKWAGLRLQFRDGADDHPQEVFRFTRFLFARSATKLHFGLFHLLAIGWRAAGLDAEPIMEAPLRSKSVREFWGRRWNGAFNRLALDFVFRPLARRQGIRIATLAAFLVSGLIHELVISLPAAGGYSLPTAYFLLQGIGILTERALPQIRGQIFTIVITAAPAFWLFHPPFVRNVILPFMKAIGAL